MNNIVNDPEEMPSWQEKFLAQLDRRISTVFIADDPDALLTEESLQQALMSKGLDLHFYEDPIALRYFLEHKVKPQQTACVVSIDSDQFDIDAISFDISQKATRLSLSLKDCFPKLTYTVLKALQPEELNALDNAIEGYTPGELNESASSDFVLRHVFKIAPEVVQTSSDLLRALLRLHYRDIELPDVLKARLVALLKKRRQFAMWSLEAIVADKKAFFLFLQQHWPGYILEVIEALDQGIQEPKAVYLVNAESEDKIILPFGHDDVRVYIDNLFLEGYLTPIEVSTPDRLIGHWCLVGVLQDPDKEQQKRFNGLLKLCEETLPSVEDRHQNWQQFAFRWAEFSALFHFNNHSKRKKLANAEAYSDVQKKVDDVFSQWLLKKYAGLHNHPPVPPVMLHHIPRVMARQVESNQSAKVALILVDGLALDQWVTVKQKLADQPYVESSVFAWVPTVTSVSRQALFSAKAPYQFAKTIATTSSEPKAWEQFWLNYGLDKSQVYYDKGLGTDDVDALIDRLSDRRFRAVGLVINTVDDMMHGMLLGAAGMHNQVNLWAESGYLDKLLTALLSNGFSVHITSDHGNVEAVGSGKINEGAIAESRGERTRVYETETLRQSVSIESDDVLDWPQSGLPNDYWPKVMKGREAFVAKGERIVGHGGVAIEEVIVPYITVNRESNE
ncbi:BREX-3 system phosphatase PglZ [Gilvimarinus agarilyticus]|uniref:BREX-3 system phosphatase PglZ n=1 Tax=Gilvimarinus sp. 2_MG-2023 TaxID=3062666 RepID=UPI001C09FFC2|nr:BREX-3 system phosphatase PglZ [Gilvimarinus sp. 2_MG-2023]MBU2886743.1 BREX-3 system phosphatase PglZ [Gilvimarinus agarilyticus]MDO6571408.1 BREX-3 system phosphatase PglZ [Gilvimarinus sp. 2_MG-2023]